MKMWCLSCKRKVAEGFVCNIIPTVIRCKIFFFETIGCKICSERILKKKILFAISYLLGEDTKWILLQQAGNIRCSKAISRGISASQKFAARDRRLKLQQSPGAYLRSKKQTPGASAKHQGPRSNLQGHICGRPGTSAQNLKKIWTISRFVRVILAQGPC